MSRLLLRGKRKQRKPTERGGEHVPRMRGNNNDVSGVGGFKRRNRGVAGQQDSHAMEEGEQDFVSKQNHQEEIWRRHTSK